MVRYSEDILISPVGIRQCSADARTVATGGGH